MIYKVNYSRFSLNDLTGIFEYISYVLCNENAARNIVNKIMKSISLLSVTPLMHKLYDVSSCNKKNIHLFSVGNYIIIYEVNLINKEVTIDRILYSKIDLSEKFITHN